MDKYLMGDSLKPWKGGVAQLNKHISPPASISMNLRTDPL